MYKSRKAASLLLAGVMTVTLLAGCGSNGDKEKGNTTGAGAGAAANVNKEGFPIVNEKLTLTLMAPDIGIQNWNDMPVMDEMEKLTGIKFEYLNAPRDSFDTKKNLVFASGDYPNVLFGAKLTQAEELNYGGQGILIPLEDLIDEYAPNVKKLLETYPDIRKSITAPDGHIYSLPRFDLNQPWYRNPLWYNGDFLKALDIKKIPETTEELYTYLKRVKEEDPNGNGQKDEIPLASSSKMRDLRTWILGAFGAYEEEIYVDDKDVVHYTPMEEPYKAYLEYMNRLWSEELLDHESFSQTDDQKKAKAKNNQVGLFSEWHAYFTLGGEPDTEDVLFSPVKSDMVAAPAIAKNRGYSTGAFAITSSNKAPEASMRWVDYLYSYDGAMLFDKGPEGTLWKYTDKASMTKEWLPVPGGGDREEYRSTLTPNYGIAAPMVISDDLTKGLKTEFDEWVAKENKEKLLDRGARVPFPALFLTAEESAEVTKLRSDLSTYVMQMEAKFITGQDSISGWDKYVGTIKKMGGERMAAIYQTAYDRWKTS